MKNCRVLIVEDDAVNISLISGLLVKDYPLSIARTKARALQILETEEIGIVLLDLNLPDGKGIDICKRVKHGNKHSDAPIFIVMTGSNDSLAELECLRAGASDYIVKPFDVEVFKARLEIQADIITS